MSQSSLPHHISPAAEAYIWGFPLASVHRTRLLLCSKNDSGTMNHVDDLATPSDRAIVVPNNDTLYSSAWYDLRHGDLTIDVAGDITLDRKLRFSINKISEFGCKNKNIFKVK